MNNNRQSLGAYPCPIGIDTWCNAECAEAIDNCEAVTCLWLPVYRQAMADHRCARLLRVLDKRWLEILRETYLYVKDPTFRYWINLSALTRDIRNALRAAGLE